MTCAPVYGSGKNSGSCFTKLLEQVHPFTFTRISCCLPLNQLTCKLFTFLFHPLNDVFLLAETSVYKLVQVLPSLSSLQHTTDRATGSPKTCSLNWAHKLWGGLTIQNAGRARAETLHLMNAFAFGVRSPPKFMVYILNCSFKFSTSTLKFYS